MDKSKRVSAKRAAQGQKEDLMLNRILICFGTAVVVELILLLLNRYYVTPRPGKEIEFQGALLAAFPTIIAVSAVGLVASLIWLFLWHRAGKGRMFPTIFSGVFCCTLVISMVTYRFFATGVQALCGLVPAVAVLMLIYFLYQHEFFTVTLLSGLGILGLWMFRRANGGHQTVVYGYAVLVAVLLVAAALLCRSAQKNEGVLRSGGKELRLFHKNASYGMVYLTCGIVAVALAAGFILGTAAAYYLIFVLVAWLFAMAVYYTVKLM